MFASRDYQRMHPADLLESHRWWYAQIDEYADFVSHYGANRVIRRGLRRCLRQIRRIEAAARRRGIRL